MADRQVRIIVSASVEEALRGFRATEDAVRRVGSGARETTERTSSLGDKLKSGLGMAGIATGAAGVVLGFKAMVSEGLSYEQNLNKLQAVSGATSGEMAKIGETAKSLGNDITIPGASAGSAAEAMLELAKSGLTAQQAMDASRGTMVLAAAAQISGAQAAEIQGNALNTFGLKADQAARVADILANTANKSSGEITDFAQALAQSGGVANMFGVSIEDTSTVLGLFANAGLKGSDAGTSLKQSLLSMLDPTDKQAAAVETLGLKIFDAQGNFVGMRSVTADLSKAQQNLTMEQFNTAAATVFGADAVRAAAFVAQSGVKGFDDMAAAVTKVGGAQEVAAANARGLPGALEGVANAAQTAGLALYEQLSPALADVATMGAAILTKLGGLVEWFGGLPGPVKAAATAFAALVLLKGPMLGLWTAMKATGVGVAIQGEMLAARLSIQSLRLQAAASGSSMGLMAAGMRVAGVAATTMGRSIKAAFIGNPVGLAIIGITTALSFMASGSDDAATATTDFSAAVDENTGKLVENSQAVIAKATADSGSLSAYQAIGGALEDYTASLAGNGDAQDRVHTQIQAATVAALEQSGAWAEVKASGVGAYKSVDEMATAVLNGTAVTYAHNDAVDAAIGANQRFAADTDTMSEAQRLAAQKIAATGDAVKTTGDEMATAEAPTMSFADAVKAVKDAANEADTATQFLTISLQVLAGKDVSAEQATRANAAAMRDMASVARDAADAHDEVSKAQAELTELTARLGSTLNGEEASASNLIVTQADLDKATRKVADAKNREAGASDKQKDAQDKAAQSAIEMTAAAYNNTVKTRGMDAAIRAASAVMVVQRKSFIDSAIAAGVGRTAAEKLADAQGLIPGNVRTTYSSPGVGDAISKAVQFTQKLLNFDGKTFTAKIQANFVSNVGGTISSAITGALGFAGGGPVPGVGGPRQDNILAWLSADEYVMPTDKSRQYREHLDLMRAGKYADGGAVRPNYQSGRTNQGGVSQSGRTSNPSMVGSFQTSSGGFMDNIVAALKADLKFFGKSAVEAVMSSGGGGGFAGNGQWGPANFNGFAANTKAAKEFIEGRFTGFSSIGGLYGGSVPGSDHPAGKALDVMIANYLSQSGITAGTSIADWFIKNPNSFGTKYVIWRDRINQGGAWSSYSHPGGNNDTLAHRDHVHISFLTGSGQFAGKSTAGPKGDGLSLVDQIRGASQGLLGGLFGGSDIGGMPSGGSGVERWRGRVLQGLSLIGQPASLANTVLNQIRTESGGDPRAINLIDSNARRGTPSKGLIQAIDPTFQAYRLASLPNNVYDPLANIVAGMRYAIARYGSIQAGMRGVAYAAGGIVGGGNTPGVDSQWAIASPGEAFLTQHQWATAKTAVNQVAAGGSSGGVQRIIVEFRGDGAITREMASTASYTVDGAMHAFATAINRGRLQTV